MDLINTLSVSLLSPMVLAFILGILITLIRSDFKFPEGLYAALTLYLLFAIGLKGGYKLSVSAPAEFVKPVLVALALSVAIPLWSYVLLRKAGRFGVADAAAIAAHYGSVSVVTFGQGLVFLDGVGASHEGFLPALLAIMEIPGILVALFLARKMMSNEGGSSGLGGIMHELLAGKGTVLLLGGICIGLITGHKGYEPIAPFFDAPFKGILTLFLLEMGMVAGMRLGDLRKAGGFLLCFGIFMPVLNGMIGVYLGHWAGLSCGGSTIMGVLAASASYISAPAAIRLALPQANPS